MLAAFLLSLLACVCAPLFSNWEFMLLDWHLRNTVAKENDQKIVLILGGDKSMIDLQAWPWPRSVHAALLSARLAQAKVVAYDVFLVDKTAPEQDTALAQAIASHGNVVLGDAFRADGVFLQPLELFREHAATGYFNFYPDGDYVVRRYPLVKTEAPDGTAFLPSFVYAVLEAAGQQPELTQGPTLRLSGGKDTIPLDDNFAVYKLSVPKDAYPIYEFSDVLQGKIPAETFEDAIVFVGMSAVGVSDNIHTSEGYLAGTKVLADIFYALSSGYMPQEPALGVQLFFFSLLAFSCIAGTMVFPSRLNWLPAVLCSGVLILSSHLLFQYAGVYFPAAPMAFFLVLTGISLVFYLRVLRENQQKQAMLMNMITCLVSAIDAKDPVTAGHSQRVSEISALIAKRKGLRRKEVENIRLSALIHDIGKIGVADAVLNKPGKFTPEEFEEMKAHPEKGLAIMQHAGLPESVISGIIDHHERQDGKGYPNGKMRGDLSLSAEIIKIADVYDALISKRQYKDSWPIEKVCNVLYEGRGTEFNADLIDVFLEEISPPDWQPPHGEGVPGPGA